jgi:hypothetical protein
VEIFSPTGFSLLPDSCGMCARIIIAGFLRGKVLPESFLSKEA